MKWNNSSRTLTIGAREGSYPGMLNSRTFTITHDGAVVKKVEYSGKKVVVAIR
ncbi:MAG: DUF5110 domain-containing protein [Dysgonamonadaceae bacterium]|jgi:alpha-D-xyloside xylohydrolase|nr:DUF5110 domain-containing protein [Dysgonamonadaceae bacterium]